MFHAGDGNLHPLILFDANVEDEVARAEAFGAAILELCIEVGGTITGEHGVGVEKLPQMCVQFAPAELERFLGIKAAFDAHGCSIPARACRRSRAAPSSARCTSITASCRIRTFRASRPRKDRR